MKFGEESKILEVDAARPRFELTDAIRRRFHIAPGDHIAIREYVKKYDEYVDVEDGTELRDGCKLLVICKR